MIIYKVTNKINGMVYIGQTCRSLEKRWRQHKDSVKRSYMYGKLKQAIIDYGAASFTVEQIDIAASKEEADEKETYWISFYDSVRNGYNTGRGGKHCVRENEIVCVETGKVYRSTVAAAKEMGVSTGSVWQAVKNPTWVCCGYHWRRVKKG